MSITSGEASGRFAELSMGDLCEQERVLVRDIRRHSDFGRSEKADSMRPELIDVRAEIQRRIRNADIAEGFDPDDAA